MWSRPRPASGVGAARSHLLARHLAGSPTLLLAWIDGSLRVAGVLIAACSARAASAQIRPSWPRLTQPIPCSPEIEPSAEIS